MEIDLTDQKTYSLWMRMTLRFSDQDVMGHVNNAVYAQWFEAPRVLLLAPFVADEINLNTVLARITINYLRETRFPGEVDVGGRLLSLGRRSLRSGFAVFRDGECLATAECTNVFFDTVKRQSTDPSEHVRAAIEQSLSGP
jgi:acyl-CoA thioester hydrolase